MREMIEAGAIGRLTTFRAREGHSGPHAAHFWDAELAGGGALLDMASHGAEAARYLFGKDVPVRDVFAWGATLVHGDKTTGEDNAVMLVRFDDDRVATMDVSWSSKGGLESRFEVYGDAGRIVQDITLDARCARSSSGRPATSARRPTPTPAGSSRSPTRPYVHGHDAMMRHVVESFRDGADAARDVPRRASSSTRSSTPPTARCAAGAGKRSSSPQPAGEPADDEPRRQRPALDRRGDPPARASWPRPRPTPSRQASQWCAEAIAADGLVHLFGTGHSRIPVEEMFPRYGSYPGFNPIVELSMTFHTQVVGANGQRQAMFIERTPGLAEVILSTSRSGRTTC